MRGTVDVDVFRKFAKAVSGFPPRGRDGLKPQEVFIESCVSLRELSEITPPFPRAIAWRGYALALSVLEGWPLDGFPSEMGKSDDDRLALALSFTTSAKELDPYDYDLWWAHADVLLIKKEFVAAAKAFERALFLNRDEINPNLYADAAEAMAFIGNHDRADKLLHRAFRRPDWHHWVKARIYFIKAGRVSRAASADAKREEMTFLDLGLAQIKSTSDQPGDVCYLHDIQLLLSAIHARKHTLLLAQSGKEALAAREAVAARTALDDFRSVFTFWTPELASSKTPYQDPDDAAYWIENVTAALTLSNQAAD